MRTHSVQVNARTCAHARVASIAHPRANQRRTLSEGIYYHEDCFNTLMEAVEESKKTVMYGYARTYIYMYKHIHARMHTYIHT
jgi:hypothetical protein